MFGCAKAELAPDHRLGAESGDTVLAPISALAFMHKSESRGILALWNCPSFRDQQSDFAMNRVDSEDFLLCEARKIGCMHTLLIYS